MKVLFLVAGGLQAGFLGCYGNQRLATPAFDRLAADGIVFDQHLADVPSAAGARRAWRTGRYHFAGLAQETSAPDLLQLLRAGDVATSLIVGPAVGCADDRVGWAHIEEVSNRDTRRLLAAVRRSLTRWRASDRCFLRADMASLVPPWQIPAKFLDPQFQHEVVEEEELELGLDKTDAGPLEPLLDSAPGLLGPHDEATFLRIQGTYSAAVEHFDDLLGKVLELAGLDDFLIVVTADRGYPLGEHGLVGEGRPWLHEGRIHLPLIVRRPGGAEAGLRVPFLTQAIDLPAMLLEAFGLPVPPEMHGRSLWPLLHGEFNPVRDFACSALEEGEAAEWALRTPDWHFVLPVRSWPGDPPRRPQLYVKPDDRWEVNDVVQHHLELAESLEQTLRACAEASRRPGPFQPPALRQPIAGGTQP